MGDKVIQDLGITIEQMHALMNRYEDWWVAASENRVVQKGTLFPALCKRTFLSVVVLRRSPDDVTMV